MPGRPKQKQKTNKASAAPSKIGALVGRVRSVPRSHWLAAMLIVVTTLAAYLNSFSGSFIFDDVQSITENATIRQLWPISQVLSPPSGGYTVSGRPLVNLSFAVNYALGGYAVWGYHALNLAIHILAALTLAGIVRRTLLQPALAGRFGAAALPVATAVAILWAVHPLQTESVTYIVQRAESLMGLFYLLTIYCFIRATESRTTIWKFLTFAFCLCGMATKEVMVTAPLMVLLYDRTFVAGNFRDALRLRWRLYLGLAATWLLLGLLVATSGSLSSDNTGFNNAIGWRSYALTQCWALVHYLWLCVWPNPLVLDYGGKVLVESAKQVLPCALILAALLGGTVVSLRRWPAIGFVGCWFFGILALTSSVLPLGDTMFEHRMYLPLAAVIALAVVAIQSWAGRWSRVVFVALTLVFIGFTVRRNHDYRSELAIWGDTVAKRPGNARARNSLGTALLKSNQPKQAMARFRETLQIQTNYAPAHMNVAALLQLQGRVEEANTHYEEALRLSPDYAEAHYNYASHLAAQGTFDEAEIHFHNGLRLKKDWPELHFKLGYLLSLRGNLNEAEKHLRLAIKSLPKNPEAARELAWVLATSDDRKIYNPTEAIHLAERACELTQRGDASCLDVLAVAYSEARRFDDAIKTAERAAQLAEAGGDNELASQIQERLKNFREGRSYRETTTKSKP